jgi:hypothetical protein
MDEKSLTTRPLVTNPQPAGTYIGQGVQVGLLKRARRVVATWEPTYRRDAIVRVNCRPHQPRDVASCARASSALDAYHGPEDVDGDGTFVTSA